MNLHSTLYHSHPALLHSHLHLGLPRGHFLRVVRPSFYKHSSYLTCKLLPIPSPFSFISTSYQQMAKSIKFYVLLTVQPCIIFFQMKQTRCTLLLSIFISTSLHVSGNYVPIIRRTYCIYATLVFFTLYGWLSGQQTRQPPILLSTEPPIQNEKYQCRIDTVSYPDDGHIVARNM